ncbi:MAG: nucleotidyltransferase domain-containing protein [Candidatus Margulisiibacteriota bacterium]
MAIGKLNEIENSAVKEFKEKIMAAFGARIKELLLFGSKARGDFNAESDIDIFILVDKSDPNFRKKVASFTTEVLIKYGILLSPKIIEESHFSFLKKLEFSFAKNIEKDGIKI